MSSSEFLYLSVSSSQVIQKGFSVTILRMFQKSPEQGFKQPHVAFHLVLLKGRMGLDTFRNPSK